MFSRNKDTSKHGFQKINSSLSKKLEILQAWKNATQIHMLISKFCSRSWYPGPSFTKQKTMKLESAYGFDMEPNGGFLVEPNINVNYLYTVTNVQVCNADVVCVYI